MQEQTEDILTPDIVQPNGQSRRGLLPLWIRIFTWIFMVFGLLIPVNLALAFFGVPRGLALYGLKAPDIFSVMGILLATLYLVKGITAVGLWWEMDWAISLGLIDTVLGITVCVLGMLYPAIDSSYRFTFRLELFALVPYLKKLLSIRLDWARIPKR